MATKSIKIDDLSGDELPDDITPTVLIYNGSEYHLDLGAESLEKLDEVLAPFLHGADSSRTRAFVDPSVIREWARTQGDMEVWNRGRLSQEMVNRYNEAHGIPLK